MLPGTMLPKKKAGYSTVGLPTPLGPDSRTRMERSGSASARREATMQPAVPPGMVG